RTPRAPTPKRPTKKRQVVPLVETAKPAPIPSWTQRVLHALRNPPVPVLRWGGATYLAFFSVLLALMTSTFSGNIFVQKTVNSVNYVPPSYHQSDAEYRQELLAKDMSKLIAALEAMREDKLDSPSDVLALVQTIGTAVQRGEIPPALMEKLRNSVNTDTHGEMAYRPAPHEALIKKYVKKYVSDSLLV